MLERYMHLEVRLVLFFDKMRNLVVSPICECDPWLTYLFSVSWVHKQFLK